VLIFVGVLCVLLLYYMLPVLLADLVEWALRAPFSAIFG
jgi:hypothetical protein